MASSKIAIVGLATRLPGGPLNDLWHKLCAGEDLVTTIPSDRWSLDSFLHPDKSHAGTFYSRRAGSIGDVSGFDAEFFGISPREAEQLDPQQRILLELAWEAFEDAGIPPSVVRGADGGVFIGFSGSDWSYRRADDLAAFDANSMTGQTGSVAANRISYQFDLRGPSLAVDTACSSSLVAFHQACQSVASGESAFALAGGITLHLHPLAFVGFARASMLSPRGVCNVFDAAGDGYVRAEGGGMFLLKPLDKALADGDRIHAVVAASGVNCDGRTQGITVPGADAQAALLRRVYDEAGIDPATLDYVEAHGTGTAVGDPIECRALGRQLGSRRPAERPLPIGSVKSNVGHLETASGVAGLAKALLCLRHRAVPPTRGIRQLNPAIEFDAWNLHPVTELTPLPQTGQLTVGVNSFGFGGANAHVVLQTLAAETQRAATVEPDEPATRPDSATQAGAPPLRLSARSKEALTATASRVADYLERPDSPDYYDVAYTAAVHRDWLPHRLIAFPPEPGGVTSLLRQFAEGNPPAYVVTGTPLADASGAVFVYSGNGSQWAGMGVDLIAQSQRFAEAVAEVDAIFASFGDFSIVDLLHDPEIEQKLEATEFAQPALFAIQVGVTSLLRDLHCLPAAVVGHSVGEVAAAWACGALTLRQAVQVIYERSKHQGTTRGDGEMTAVGASAVDVQALFAEFGLADDLTIAGVNSPRGVTVAGDAAMLARLETELAEREVFFRRLALDYAFHSPAMDPIEQPLKRDLARLVPGAGEIPFYSTVAGRRLAGKKLTGDYWWRNIREPVLFQDAIDRLLDDRFNLFVEVGPHAVLRTYVNDCVREHQQAGRVIATLQRGNGGLERVQSAAFEALLSAPQLDAVTWFERPGRFVDLPGYVWQRRRYWHPVSPEGYQLVNRTHDHRLLGYRLQENAWQWENEFDLARFPDLGDHVVGDTAVMPAAGFVEMALAAARCWHRRAAAESAEVPGFLPLEIEELEILAPLLLDAQGSRKVRLQIDPTDGRFQVRSRAYLADTDWQLHVVGRLPQGPSTPPRQKPMVVPQRVADADSAQHYALTARVGLDYGPAYQAVTQVWFHGASVIATLARPVDPAEERATAARPSSRSRSADCDCGNRAVPSAMRVRSSCAVARARWSPTSNCSTPPASASHWSSGYASAASCCGGISSITPATSSST